MREDGAVLPASIERVELSEKKSTGAPSTSLGDVNDDTGCFGVKACDDDGKDLTAPCILEAEVEEPDAAAVAGPFVGVDVAATGLSPSMALKASFVFPFAFAPSASDLEFSTSSFSGILSRMLSAASGREASTSSSRFISALLASSSLFLSANTPSSLRLGAGSMPNSECFDVLAPPNFGFFSTSDRTGPASSDSLSGDGDWSESTLITFLLHDELAEGGGKDSPLDDEEEEAGSFDPNPDFFGGDGGGDVDTFEDDAGGCEDEMSSSSESLAYPASEERPDIV